MRRLLSWWVLWLSLTLASSAFAQGAGGYLLVTDFEGPKGGNDAVVEALTEVVIVEVSRLSSYEVITRGARDATLAEHGFQCDDVVDASCTVQMGKLVGAGVLIEGKVQRVGDLWLISATLVDVSKAVIRSSAQVSCECSEEDVVLQGSNLVAQLFGVEPSREAASSAPPPVVRSGPIVEGGEVTEALGRLIVEGSPRGGRVDVKGPRRFEHAGALPLTLPGLKPGTYEVTTSATGYESKTDSVEVAPDRTATLVVELTEPGTLEVTGRPDGAEVTITGPGGFSVVKGLPVTVRSAPTGTYHIEVNRSGYETWSKSVTVQPRRVSRVEAILTMTESPRRPEIGPSLRGFAVDVFYASRRERDAHRVADLLRGAGARVVLHLDKGPISSMDGRLYYNPDNDAARGGASRPARGLGRPRGKSAAGRRSGKHDLLPPVNP